jgi:hypothetical protein
LSWIHTKLHFANCQHFDKTPLSLAGAYLCGNPFLRPYALAWRCPAPLNWACRAAVLRDGRRHERRCERYGYKWRRDESLVE